MGKYLKYLWIVLIIFLSGCGSADSVEYQNLFKITRNSINDSFNKDHLIEEAVQDVNNFRYRHAVKILNEYLAITREADYIKDVETLLVMMRSFLGGGDRTHLREISQIALKYYPTNQAIVYSVLNAGFTLNDRDILDSVGDSPVLSAPEKGFIDFWEIRKYSDLGTMTEGLRRLKQCGTGVSGVCRLITRSQDIALESGKFKDEPMTFLYALLAREYINADLSGLAYYITKDIEMGDYRDGLLIKGLAALGTGDFEGAYIALGKVYEKDPGFSDGLIYFLQSLYNTDRWQELIGVGSLALGLRVNTVEIRNYVAEAYLQVKSYDDLRKFLLSQVRDYGSEFSQDLFSLLFLVLTKAQYTDNAGLLSPYMDESQAKLYYKVLDKSVDSRFFEKNFKSGSDLPLFVRLSWLIRLLDEHKSDKARLVLDDIISSSPGNSIRELVGNMVYKGMLPVR